MADRQREYPFKLQKLDEATNQRIATAFKSCPNSFQAANHFGFKVSGTATDEMLKAAYNYPLDPRDIWLVSPPKNGNTWAQEMIWLLANDLDYAGAARPLMPDRWNFLDFPLVNDAEWEKGFFGNLRATKPEALKGAKPITGDPNRPSPKFIKSHLPFSMNNPDLLSTCKTFFVARNPKDACLSFFKHCRLFKNRSFVEDLDSFAELYMAGNVFETPVVPCVIEAWNLRHHPNLCLVFYEELQRDLPGQLRRMAKFLGKDYSDAEYEKLQQHLHIDSFRKNPYVNMSEGFTKELHHEGEGTFIRKGVVGDWSNHFSPELSAKFDAWLEKQLIGTDLKFVTKL